MSDRSCYETAFKMMMLLGPTAKLMLVHGYPRLTREDEGVPEGTRYGHAWLEVGRVDDVYVLDVMTMNWLPRSLYYKVGRIEGDQCCRYTYEEALHKVKEHGTHGDWNAKPPVGTAYYECKMCGGIGTIGDGHTERPCPTCSQ